MCVHTDTLSALSVPGGALASAWSKIKSQGTSRKKSVGSLRRISRPTSRLQCRQRLVVAQVTLALFPYARRAYWPWCRTLPSTEATMEIFEGKCVLLKREKRYALIPSIRVTAHLSGHCNGNEIVSDPQVISTGIDNSSSNTLNKLYSSWPPRLLIGRKPINSTLSSKQIFMYKFSRNYFALFT